jgi:TRAP-type C4-dicarboxylate transport system substrate-binding protein
VSIASQCPGCARKFNAPDQLVGKNVRCPQCNTSFALQAAAGGAPANFDFAAVQIDESFGDRQA